MLTSPSGKSYIGQTTRPIEKRFQTHQQKSSGCVAIYRAIQKHGWENFEKDWYECPDEDLDFDEELLVREMDTLAPRGYNLKEGGGSTGKLSEETKQKMSEAQRGDKNHNYGKTSSDETKQKLSEVRLGIPKSDGHRRKISEAMRGEKHYMYGKIPSDETKQKMSKSHRGEKNHNSKRVYQYDLEGNYIRSFGSSGEAGRYIEKDGANIRTCARSNKQKIAYEFRWSYDPPLSI